jgi:GntR family transcriptional regulator, transcriptional repressor for pyruvate dehydrogenase complex
MGEQPAVADARGPDDATDDLLAAIRPVEPTRLADRVVEQVRELIQRLGLEPGERLPSERDLAARLGTSRAIVSQALRTLSVMGLVEVRPGSGAYVTRNPQAMFVASMDLLLRADEESADAIAELRFWLESAGAARAVEVAGAGETEEIEQAFARLESSTGSTSEWVAADTIFHAAVVRAAGNPLLGPLYEAVHTAMVSVLYEEWVESDVPPTWLQGDNRRRQVDLHRPIFEAIRDRDVDRLRQALQDHHDVVLEHFDDYRRRASGG